MSDLLGPIYQPTLLGELLRAAKSEVKPKKGLVDFEDPSTHPELRGMEQEIAEWSANLKLPKGTPVPGLPPYVGEQLVNNGGLYALAMTYLKLVPFGSFAAPSSRDAFLSLDEDQQDSVAMWEGVGAAMAALGSVAIGVKWLDDVLRGGKKLVRGTKSVAPELPRLGKVLVEGKGGTEISALAKKFSSRMITPVEDFAPGWEGFDIAKGVKSVLGKRRFGEVDLALLAEAAKGNRLPLHRAIAEAMVAGGEVPAKWRKLVEFIPGKGFGLNAEWTEKLSEKAMRQRWAVGKLRRQISPSVPGVSTKERVEQGYRALANERYGWDVATKVPMEELPEERLSWLWHDLMTGKGVKTVERIDDLAPQSKWFASLTPKRVVYGMNEAVHGAYSGVYKPISEGLVDTRIYMKNMLSTWNEMLFQRGLVRKLKDVQGFQQAVDFRFSRADAKAAREFLDFADNAVGSAKGQGEKALLEARAGIQERMEFLVTNQPKAASLVDSFYDYTNRLYRDWTVWSLSDMPGSIRARYPMTSRGFAMFDELQGKWAPKLNEAFSTQNSWDFTSRLGLINDMLKDYQRALGGANGEELFELTGKTPLARRGEAEETLLALLDEFTIRKGKTGQWLPYLESYAPRVEADQKFMGKIFRTLNPSEPFYRKDRRLPSMIEDRGDLESLLQARTRAQAKDMFLRNKLEVAAANAKNLPTALRDYTTHFVASATGLPTATDEKIAQWISKLPFTKTWDAERVVAAGRLINDITYMGALGLKPFSAMRNLFQPLLTVPADLGGTRDILWLGRGYARALSPEFRRLCQDIGIIAEYAPEAAPVRNFLPFGREIGGLGLPRADKFRDAMMLLFKGSDQINRYVTAGAAMEKWQWALRSLGELSDTNIDLFLKKAGVNGRNPWVRANIRDLLVAGQRDRAMHAFMSDVVADTQYLYGAIDAPAAATKFGAAGRTGTIFQSWWMNYATLLSKWGRLGTTGEKAARAGGFFTSTFLAYLMLEPMFGQSSAVRTVGLGPMPSEFFLPPAWKPIYHTLQAMRLAAEAPFTGDLDPARERMKKAIDAGWIIVPAGLQAKRMVRGYDEGGLEGMVISGLGLTTD